MPLPGLLPLLPKILGQIKTLANGESVEMLTGTCSNPEPPEAITSLPLGPIEIAWYLLAKCDVAIDGDAGIARTIEARLGDRTIPSIETSFRFDMVNAAIKTGDTTSFVQAVIRWLDAATYLDGHRAELMTGDPLNFKFGHIATLATEQRSDSVASGAAVAAVQALAIYSITADRPFPAAELVAGFKPHLLGDHPAVKFLSQLERAAPIIDATSSSTAVLSSITARAARDPEDSLIASIHLLELTLRTDYRRLLEQPVSSWIAEEWTKVANKQQFAIVSPQINGPAILTAVERSKGNLASAADIILTALLAVKTNLHPELRHRLEELRKEGEPKKIIA
jgi:hypothetical protein